MAPKISLAGASIRPRSRNQVPRARGALPAPTPEIERPTVRPRSVKKKAAPEAVIIELWAPRYRDERRE